MEHLLLEFFEAARSDGIDRVNLEKLKKAGCSLRNDEGLGLVHIAAQNGSLKFLSCACIELELSVWDRDNSGYLPIDHALAFNQTTAYEFLDELMYPSGWWDNNCNAI